MNRRVRALIGLTAYAVLVFLVLPAKRHWLAALIPGGRGVVEYLVDHFIELAAILVFAWVMAAVERRSFAAFGLPWRAALGARFWQGAAVGLVSLALLVSSLCAVGALRVEIAPTPALEAAAYGLAYAVVFILLALREEFLYRGYGLFALTSLVGFWPASLASSAWFAWSHAGNANENVFGIASVACFGLLACLSLRRTGNLWLVIGFHAVWDWGQSYLFGVGDSGHPPPPGHLLTSTVSPSAPAWLSGGSVGPEGSALCAALLISLWIVCARVFREVRYPQLPG